MCMPTSDKNTEPLIASNSDGFHSDLEGNYFMRFFCTLRNSNFGAQCKGYITDECINPCYM